jgi:hypothetical protein
MALTTIKIIRPYMTWPVGNVREVSEMLANQLVDGGFAKRVEAEKPEPADAPAKRGPGRPRKVKPENKAVGA